MDSQEIYTQSIRHFLSPVISLLDNPEVSEILINGPEKIYYEKDGILHPSDCRFPSERLLMAAAVNIAEYSNRRIDERHHSMDARLPDKSRVHVIIPPSSRNGVCISIRKFKKATFDLDILASPKYASLSEEAVEFLRLLVILHKNTVISGGTGSGKTSMLNALSASIPDRERIVVIEDSSELQLDQEHTVYLEAQPPAPNGLGGVTIRDLFVDSLRMRPDRIIVGEVRRGEALDLIQSMLSGHEGSLTTVHANTPRDAAVRLETLCLMSDVTLPIAVARIQVASAVQVVVQVARLRDGSRRVLGIAECLGLDEKNNYIFSEIYKFHFRGIDPETGRINGELLRTDNKPSFADEPVNQGIGHLVQKTAGVFTALT